MLRKMRQQTINFQNTSPTNQVSKADKCFCKAGHGSLVAGVQVHEYSNETGSGSSKAHALNESGQVGEIDEPPTIIDMTQQTKENAGKSLKQNLYSTITKNC